MKLNLKFLFYLPLILFFFQCFTFVIPGLKGAYSYFFLVLYALIFILVLFNGAKLFRSFILITRTTPLKYLILALVGTIITTIIASINHLVSMQNAIHSIVFQIFLFILPILIYFLFVIDKYISFNSTIKFFVLLLWLNLISGFIAFIGQLLNIDFIISIYDFFANSRILKVSVGSDAQVSLSNYVAFGLPRLDNLQEEPSYHARFLYLFLPFVYTFVNFKDKILNNKNLDYIIKKTIIPFTWINLILTFSPMYLMLGFLITFIYYFKILKKILKNYFFIFVTLLLLLLFIITNQYMIEYLSDTFISRIINIFTIKCWEDFIDIEPSLATRLICYINTFIIFLQNPLYGVGIGNIQKLICFQYLNSPIPLSNEILYKTNILFSAIGTGYYNSNYVIQILTESGIFVFVLYVIFYYKIYQLISEIFMLNAKDINSIDYCISKSLKYTLIALYIVFFYEFPTIKLEIFFIIVLTIAYIRRTICNNQIFIQKKGVSGSKSELV